MFYALTESELSYNLNKYLNNDSQWWIFVFDRMDKKCLIEGLGHASKYMIQQKKEADH